MFFLLVHLRISLHLLKNHPHGGISHDLLNLGVVHRILSHLQNTNKGIEDLASWDQFKSFFCVFNHDNDDDCGDNDDDDNDDYNDYDDQNLLGILSTPSATLHPDGTVSIS